jgi:hypothetical protein
VVRQSRVEDRHDFRRGRTEKVYWFVVVDKETDEPASDEYSEHAHAQQHADRLNGRHDRPDSDRQRALAHRPLRRQVESILDDAGCLNGGCPRHKTPPMVTLHTDKDGSVLIRPVPPGHVLFLIDRDKQMEFQVQRCAGPLTKAGLFVSEGRDGQGPYLRAIRL